MADTIFAVATGMGRAAIVVVRLSGPGAAAALVALAGPLPPPRVATLRRLRDAGGEPIDRALVLWFPAPHSATGEDYAELHLHGGRAVVAAALAALGRLPGCRLAGPGDFTRRAFANGKLDLAAVEGLADLIDAETEAQRRQALRQLDGALGGWVAVQRGRLVQAMAAAESAIDFSDEADVAGDFAREVHAHAAALLTAIDGELAQAAIASRVRDGILVALAGPPNAGKSTLLNALARREVAIVSPLPGTTRDPIEVQLDLAGYLVRIVDTAGLRDTDDPIEQQGVARALERARAADLVLWLSDARAPSAPDASLTGGVVWPLASKIDLVAGRHDAGGDGPRHAVSAVTGEGMSALIDDLKRFIGVGPGESAGVTTRARHRLALTAARVALAAILDPGERYPLELAAERLREVATCLDSLVGRIDTDEVLGAIFARFCVGK